MERYFTRSKIIEILFRLCGNVRSKIIEILFRLCGNVRSQFLFTQSKTKVVLSDVSAGHLTGSIK